MSDESNNSKRIIIAALIASVILTSVSSQTSEIDQKISLYKSLGLDVSRLQDINKEIVSASTPEIQASTSLMFWEVSRRVDSLLSDISYIRGNKDFLLSDEVLTLQIAEQMLVEGRYEEASIKVDRLKENLYGRYDIKYNNISGILYAADISFNEAGIKSYLIGRCLSALTQSKENKSLVSLSQIENLTFSIKETYSLVIDSKNKMDRIVSMGVERSGTQDLYFEMLDEFETNDFTRVNELSELISKDAGESDKYRQEHDNIIDRVQEYEGDNSDIVKIITSSEELFRKGRFMDANSALSDANDLLIDAEANRISLKRSYLHIKDLLIDNWDIIIVISFVCTLICITLIYIFKYKIMKSQYHSCRIQKERLFIAMKALQKEYFAERRISRRSYDIKLKEYHRLEAKIIRRMSFLEGQLQIAARKN